MKEDPFLGRLRRYPAPKGDESAREKALHRSLAAFRGGSIGSAASRPASGGRAWAWSLALGMVLVAIGALAFFEKRRADETATLVALVRQVGAVFDTRLAAIVIEGNTSRLILTDGDDSGASGAGQPILLTVSEAGGKPFRIVTFSGKSIPLRVGGRERIVQVLSTGSGATVLTGGNLVWDSRKGNTLEDCRIEVRAL